ncbi:MAG: MarR family transcriptional regulator [Verrucomicrobiae bacterium]|nr:MarR family transcriptional regulator [Verrucomicrobiae bacterium]
MSEIAVESPRYQALIQLLRTAEDLWNASRTFFQRWNLSPSQFNLLNVLRHQPAGRSQSELSRLLIMHRSNATGLVDRLERRGLVRRLDDPHDRRIYRVILTPDGDRLLDDILPHYYAAAERVWAIHPDERVAPLVRELQELARQAGAVASSLNAFDPSTPAHSGPLDTRRPRRASHPRPDATAAPAPPGDSLRTSDL